MATTETETKAADSRSCARLDCISGKPAFWYPVLVLYASEMSAASHAVVKVPICHDCRDRATVSWFLSDAGFGILSARFAEAGKAVPRRSLARLAWTPIMEGIGQEP